LFQEWNEKFDEKIEKMREENEKLDQIDKLNKIDKYLNMRDDGELIWQIGKINEIKSMGREFFYDKQNPYKMNFELQNINNELNIWLGIYSGAFDDDLKWRFQADIKIDIYTLNNENIFKRVTKSWKIEKPESGDPIKISHSDLTNQNLINKNCKLEFNIKFT